MTEDQLDEVYRLLRARKTTQTELDDFLKLEDSDEIMLEFPKLLHGPGGSARMTRSVELTVAELASGVATALRARLAELARRLSEHGITAALAES